MTHHSSFALSLLGPLLVAQTVLAHGGQYRGPGEVAPSSSAAGSGTGTSGQAKSGSSGSGSSKVDSPAGSASTSSSSTRTASAPGGPSSMVRGARLEDDLTRWEFWWEFGKDPYLRLREAIYGQRGRVGLDDAMLNPRFANRRRDVVRPTDADLQRVADTLVAVLKQAEDRDTVSGCLVALAKIGRNGAGWDLRSTILPFLARNDQEQRETAAIALGIGGQADRQTLELLIDLAQDTEAGRRVSGQASVNERTRAFAAYGLGLLLQRNREPALAHRGAGALRALLAEPAAAGRDLKVAAIEALSLFPRMWESAAAGTLRGGIVDALGAYYQKPLGPGEQLVQSHVPPAIGRLLLPGDVAATVWKQVFAQDLARGLAREGPLDAHAKVNPHIAQSCALALGSLCAPWNDDKDPDASTCNLLLEVYRGHRDQQARSFAVLALARAGGTSARDALLHELDGATRAIEQPWIGVALGVWVARAMQAAAAAGQAADADRAVIEALRKAFAECRTPNAMGALALALGLAQDTTSSASVRAALVDHAHRDELAGYLALSLGLMDDPNATGEIRALLPTASRRPYVMLQCVRALGLLGDSAVVDDLCHQLDDPDPSLVRLSAVASALGQIGDRRSLDPLLRMLQDPRLTPLTRAFAAVALGSVCDKDPLPWNAAYATHGNYRAATETLTNGSSGILDIL